MVVLGVFVSLNGGGGDDLCSLPSKHEALAQRWHTVYDVGPTVNQRWANVSCLLGNACYFSACFDCIRYRSANMSDVTQIGESTLWLRNAIDYKWVLLRLWDRLYWWVWLFIRYISNSVMLTADWETSCVTYRLECISGLNVVSLLVQRLRRWPNNKPTFVRQSSIIIDRKNEPDLNKYRHWLIHCRPTVLKAEGWVVEKSPANCIVAEMHYKKLCISDNSHIFCVFQHLHQRIL